MDSDQTNVIFSIGKTKKRLIICMCGQFLSPMFITVLEQCYFHAIPMTTVPTIVLAVTILIAVTFVAPELHQLAFAQRKGKLKEK